MGPRLHGLLWVVFVLFALLGANSAYLAAVTFLEWFKGELYQNYFYQIMFLGHLILGVLLVLPFILFAFSHLRLAFQRKNRRAVKVGYALLIISLLLLISGFALMRVEGFEIRDPNARTWLYWTHVITRCWPYGFMCFTVLRVLKSNGKWALAGPALWLRSF